MLNTKKFKNLIFDFDGVILDSVKIKNESFKELVKNYDRNIQIKFFDHHISNLGLSRYKKFAYLKKLLSKNKDYKYNNIPKKFENILNRKIKNAKLIKGVKNFLKKNKKKKLFISSGTPNFDLKKIVKRYKIDKYFLEVLGSPRSKKQHITFLKKKYKIHKKNTVFFGDSMSDYYAAEANKFRFIQVGNNMKNSKVKLKIKDFNDKKYLHKLDNRSYK